MKFFLIFFIFLFSNVTHLQSQNTDTFRYKSVGNIVDTFYYTKEYLNINTYKINHYYGLSDNSNLSSSVDTLIVSIKKWKRFYKNKIVPFLSIKDFNSNRTIFEFLNRDSSDYFYNKYIPVKKLKIKGVNFYLYRVVPMYGKGRDPSLGNGPYYIVFNFTHGEVYRRTDRVAKILEGFEEYTIHFKW